MHSQRSENRKHHDFTNSIRKVGGENGRGNAGEKPGNGEEGRESEGAPPSANSGFHFDVPIGFRSFALHPFAQNMFVDLPNP